MSKPAERLLFLGLLLGAVALIIVLEALPDAEPLENLWPL